MSETAAKLIGAGCATIGRNFIIKNISSERHNEEFSQLPSSGFRAYWLNTVSMDTNSS
jgi:hypothetical protein